MKTETLLLSLAFLTFVSGCVSKPIRAELEDGDLLDAIKADDVDDVAKRLRNVSPDSLLFGDPLLMNAATRNAAGVIELLLRKGADKEQRVRLASDALGPRILEFYLSSREYRNEEVNERVVALLQRDRPNTPQEDNFELLEEAIVNTFYRTNVAFRLSSVSGLPPSADMAKLQKALVRKGYPLSRDNKNTEIDSIEITFERVDENTYTVLVVKNKDIFLGSVEWEGKLEKRFGYWMYRRIAFAIS